MLSRTLAGVAFGAFLALATGTAAADLTVNQRIKVLDIKERSMATVAKAAEIANNPASSQDTLDRCVVIHAREYLVFDRCERLLGS